MCSGTPQPGSRGLAGRGLWSGMCSKDSTADSNGAPSCPPSLWPRRSSMGKKLFFINEKYSHIQGGQNPIVSFVGS